MKMKIHRDSLIPTRRSLLSRLKDWNDQKSWRDFFDTYWKLIYGVSRRAGLSDAEAQDVVQEVLVGVTKKIKEFRYDPAMGSFKGWLMTLTRWRIIDQMRGRGLLVRQSVPLDHEEGRTAAIDRIPDPEPPALESMWEEEWTINLAEAALRRVRKKTRPRQFQIFECYVVKGWKVGEITKTLGVSAGQVYLAKHRVGALLRREVELLEKESL